MDRIRRITTAFALVCAAAVIAAGCGGETTDVSGGVADLNKTLKDENRAAELDCPKEVDGGKGTEFECTLKATEGDASEKVKLEVQEEGGEGPRGLQRQRREGGRGGSTVIHARIALVLTAAVALLAAGCGGEKTDVSKGVDNLNERLTQQGIPAKLECPDEVDGGEGEFDCTLKAEEGDREQKIKMEIYKEGKDYVVDVKDQPAFERAIVTVAGGQQQQGGATGGQGAQPGGQQPGGQQPGGQQPGGQGQQPTP
jgi:hypothetical protein